MTGNLLVSMRMFGFGNQPPAQAPFSSLVFIAWARPGFSPGDRIATAVVVVSRPVFSRLEITIVVNPIGRAMARFALPRIRHRIDLMYVPGHF